MLVALEGIDGTGKSTQVRNVASRLKGMGLSVTTTREPGGTPKGELIRNLILNKEKFSRKSMTLLMMASRIEHINDLIIPELNRGHIVLTDRFTLSTVAYQGISKSDMDIINTLSSIILKPFLTIYLDMDPEKCLKRIKHATGDNTRYESLEELKLIRERYLSAIYRERSRINIGSSIYSMYYHVIEADNEEGVITNDIVQNILEKWNTYKEGYELFDRYKIRYNLA